MATQDWAGLLEADLRKMMKEQYAPKAWVWFLTEPDPKPKRGQTLESIIDEQCKKLKEVSYD